MLLCKSLRIADVDSAQVHQAQIWMEPTASRNVLLPPTTHGLRLTASPGPGGVWTVSGLARVEADKDLLQRFTLKNDGPRVDLGGNWFSAMDTTGMQGAASRAVEMVPVIAQRLSSFTVNEEGTHVGRIGAFDPEGDAVTLSITCPPSAGSAEIWPQWHACVHRPAGFVRLGRVPCPGRGYCRGYRRGDGAGDHHQHA